MNRFVSQKNKTSDVINYSYSNNYFFFSLHFSDRVRQNNAVFVDGVQSDESSDHMGSAANGREDEVNACDKGMLN